MAIEDRHAELLELHRMDLILRGLYESIRRLCFYRRSIVDRSGDIKEAEERATKLENKISTYMKEKNITKEEYETWLKK